MKIMSHLFPECVAKVVKGSEILKTLLEPLFLDERFREWPASLKTHHVYSGGLTVHCHEVAKLLLNFPIDLEVGLLAAYYHDVGKLNDMVKVDGWWEYSSTYTKTSHIGESEVIFLSNCKRLIDCEKYAWLISHVCHCIRSHHGSKAYGALEEPATGEAWAVHLADMMSAFVYGRDYAPYSVKV